MSGGTIRPPCSSACGLSMRTRVRRSPARSSARSTSMRTCLMEELLVRDKVLPVRGIRLRHLAEELRPDEAGHCVRHLARQARFGMHVPVRNLRPSGPAHGAGIRVVSPAEALLVLLLGLRSVLLEFPPGPPGNRRPDAGDRRAVLQAQCHADRRIGDCGACRDRGGRRAQSLRSEPEKTQYITFRPPSTPPLRCTRPSMRSRPSTLKRPPTEPSARATPPSTSLRSWEGLPPRSASFPSTTS